MGGRLEEAESYFQQALTILREVQDRRGEANALSSLGEVALQRGQLEEAEAYYRRALVMVREMHDRFLEAGTRSGLATIYVQRGEHDLAEELYRQALDLARTTQAGRVIVRILLEFACFLIEQRDRREAGCSMLQEAIRLCAEMGLGEEQQAREAAKRLNCQAQDDAGPTR